MRFHERIIGKISSEILEKIGKNPEEINAKIHEEGLWEIPRETYEKLPRVIAGRILQEADGNYPWEILWETFEQIELIWRISETRLQEIL